jgi:hypothetical protein
MLSGEGHADIVNPEARRQAAPASQSGTGDAPDEQEELDPFGTEARRAT